MRTLNPQVGDVLRPKNETSCYLVLVEQCRHKVQSASSFHVVRVRLGIPCRFYHEVFRYDKLDGLTKVGTCQARQVRALAEAEWKKLGARYRDQRRSQRMIRDAE